MRPQFSSSNLKESVRQLCQALEGRLSFGTTTDAKGKNLDADLTVSLVISAANTDTTAAHRLGRTPSGWVVIGQTAAGSVYDATTGTADWSSTQIKLRASATGTYRLMVI